MLEFKKHEKRETSFRMILVFTVVMDLVLCQLINPRKQNKEKKEDIQQHKDEIEFSLHFFLFQLLSKRSHNDVPHFQYLFLGQEKKNFTEFHGNQTEALRNKQRCTTETETEKITVSERIKWSLFFYKISFAFPTFSRQPNKAFCKV